VRRQHESPCLLQRPIIVGVSCREEAASDPAGPATFALPDRRPRGLSPMESLKAITRNAVRLMGLKAHVGTVESG